MNKTLNQILKKLEEFANNHVLIKSMGFGTYSMLNAFTQNNNNLPLMYVQLNEFNPSASINDNLISFSFTIKILDSRGKQSDNFQDIISDTAQIVVDVSKYLTYNFEGLGFWIESEEGLSATPVVNHTNDWLTGFELNVNVYAPYVPSDCLVPLLKTEEDILLYVDKGYFEVGYMENDN